MAAADVAGHDDAPVVGIGWRHAHYAALLELRPALGFIEVHSENFFGAGGAALGLLAQAREHYPVSLHGVGLALGSAAGLNEQHLRQLADLVRRVNPVRVSDHACFARARLGNATVHAADLLPVPFNEEALAVMAANVQRAQDHLQRPLLVENLSAYLVMAGADRSETDFLNDLARQTGCALLVDVNNLYVNALNAAEPDPVGHGMRWLDRIHAPVGELHVAGHCVLDHIVIDDHGSRVAEPVWQLYRHAARRWPAACTLVEWDTDVPGLDVLLGEAACATAIALASRGAPS